MEKLITIFGATGTQGTSVIHHILNDPDLSKEFRIRGVTRDISKPAAQKLLNHNIELLTADLNNPLTIPPTLQDTHTIFLATDYWTHQSPTKEFQQAKHVIDAATAAGVKHVVFSSLDSTILHTDGRYRNVGHREGKARAEEYLQASGMKWTAVLVGYYMNNFLGLAERMNGERKEGEGIREEGFLLRYPFDGDRRILPLVDAEKDVGLFVGTILKDLDVFAGRRVLVADRYYSACEIMETFSRVTGKKWVFCQVTPEEFRALAPDGCGLEYMETHLMIDEYGYFMAGEEGLNESKELVKGETSSLGEYLERVSGYWD
ncbi:NmrA/HSCARG family protein [Aspergillus affinis]|uniref:NmrA/HSCARG family protein n=1 Tax=Aspergillus affinis TaxID=1070780 RepID=UPI0022FE16CC|nr:NAD(P)-binding protein [Aspergillus affinis]KAI9043021.1 NAD(P)-binding protein [Aspergillus affinis]